MDLLDLLASDNYIILNKSLAREIGLENAIVLGALCSYQRTYKEEEFYREQGKIIEDTCLTEYLVRKSIKELKELQLISVSKKGLPAKYYFKINTSSVFKILTSSGANFDTTGGDKIDTTLNNNKQNNKTNNKENIIKEIFEYWNLKKIVVHKTLTDEMKKQITKSLKQYSIEEIKTYIDRYSKVINDTTYMYDYKWTLVEFLSRKNGISSFADDGSKWINYNNYLNNNNNKYKVQQPKPKQDCPYDVKKIGLHFD